MRGRAPHVRRSSSTLLVAGLLGLLPRAASAERVTATVRLAPERGARVATSPRASEAGAQGRIVWLVIPRGHDVRHVAARSASPVPAVQTNGNAGPSAELVGVGAWLGYEIAYVRVHAPAGAPAADVTIEVETAPGRALPMARERLNAALAERERELVARTVANPEAVERFAPPAGRAVLSRRGFRPAAYPDLEGSDVEYVIVTNAALAPAFQALADWKTRRGVPTVVRTIESIQATTRHGADLQETVRNFLQDAYAKWSVSWVLLGGDTDIIPARYLSSSFGLTAPEQIPSDLYFAGLDGNWNADGDALWGEAPVTSSQPDPDGGDLLAELYVARAPVTTPAQVYAFVQKVVAYELPNDPTYQANALFLGEVLLPTDWDPSQPVTVDGAQLSEDMITARIPPTISVERQYEDYTSFPGSLPLSRVSSLASLTNGFNLVNHIGHGFRYNASVGDASIVNSDADALTNGPRYSILNILNCTSLAFDYSCLGEHFLNDTTGGAVAVIGASRSAYPLPAREYQDDWYELLFGQGVWHIGELFARSRLNQTPLATLESAHRWTHYIYNILAEPEMAVFAGLPAQTTVALPASLGLGPQSVMVAVTLPGGAPAVGARVCLEKGDEDYAVGSTATDGHVTLDFTPESAGAVQVTVSGRDLRTFLGTISVGAPPTASYVHLQSVTVDDDAVGGTSGNGDGVLDAGETVDLTFSLRNDGGAASAAVAGVASETDPLVNVLSGAFSTGGIAAGGSAAATPVRVQLLASAPDHHVFALTLSMTAAGTLTTDRLEREIHAPVLKLVRFEVLDGASGNGDGTPDEGEVFDLRCWVKNFGSGRVDGLNALLQTSSPFVTIYRATNSYGSIASMGEVAGAALFQMSQDVPDPSNIVNLRLTDNRGRLVVKPFDLERPGTPSDLVLDPTTGPTVVVASWTPVSVPDLGGYNIYRGPAANGPWTRVSVDPTNRIAYFRDSGLATSTKYYYCVSSIDASGFESPRSPVVSVSTNPPQVAGWPIGMAAETSSSPAIGDLDGDGVPEIVQGDLHVYAWHGDGQEILDADGNAQTWGVFSTAAGTVTGSVVLAELDGSPGLEVFACSWDDNSVVALDGDGHVLWTHKPQNGGQQGYWGTPAAADVDHDGRVEVFAPSKDGRLYAWHADGTPLRANMPDGTFATYAAYSRSSPALGNLDGDFDLEIVLTDVAGNLYAWNPDGSSLPGFPKAYGVSFNNSPVLGDVDGNGALEIIAVHQSGANNLHCLRGNGTELTGFPVTLTLKTAPVAPSPALADLDGDGKLEIVVASCDYAPSTGKLYVYRWNGTAYPGWPQNTGTDSESSPIVADLDGDGLQDIVFGGTDGILHGWRRDGGALTGFPISVGDFVRATPAVGDVDGDGGVDLVLAGWDKNLWVWDLPAAWHPAQAAWPAFLHDAQRTAQYGFEVHDATDVGQPEIAAPRRLELLQNHPNPFNPTTTIAFGSPVDGARVRLDIFDVRGQRLRRLFDGPLGAGRHRLVWDGRDDRGVGAPSGVYFYRLRWDGSERTRRMMLLK